MILIDINLFVRVEKKKEGPVLIWNGEREWIPFDTTVSLNQIRLVAEMQIFLFRILESYLVRGSDRIFESYESFFQFADVAPYLRVSIGEWLVKHGLDNQFIEHYLVPFFRVIYEQSSEMNGII